MNERSAIYSVMLVLIAANILIWNAMYAASGNILTVSFLGAGRGGAVYVHAPGGAEMLVDGGSDKSILRVLGTVMPVYDRAFDAVVSTAVSTNRMGGLPWVLARYRTGVVIDTGESRDTPIYAGYADAVATAHVRELTAARGMRIRLSPEGYADILSPQKGASGPVVLRLVYGSSSFLLMGSVSHAIQKELVDQYGTKIHSNVLIAGRYGADVLSGAFLHAVSPQHVVASADKSTTVHLSALGIGIKNTAGGGIFTFQTDGKVLSATPSR